MRAGTRRSNSGRGAKPAPSESPGAVSAAPASTCAPAETPAGCRPRIDRKSLRANRSAPAGIRRAHRAGHTADARTEPSEARAFAGRAIRILLEVLDRRRPVAQLNTLCAPALVHTVGVLVAGDHAPSRTLGTAALTKFRLFPAGDHAFELIAMYQRGPRRLALAGRVDHTATGWKLTALRLT
ncbi:Rv3235 family protein [Nocardia carnea]|uniref:Rv3235 family protein n=1 Tax=Nocardia carnea TaxID=37328 RepID=A0ABW7TKU3_9NOCA|nr:Rv3235 family protein [Nocardia carnea]